MFLMAGLNQRAYAVILFRTPSALISCPSPNLYLPTSSFAHLLDVCQHSTQLIVLHPVFQITLPGIDAGFRFWLQGCSCEMYIFIFERKVVERRILPLLAGLWSELRTTHSDIT